MKKVMLLSLLSNLLIACGFESKTDRVTVPLSYDKPNDTCKVNVSFQKFSPADKKDDIVCVVLNGANHFSENYAAELAQTICSTCRVECILLDRRGCGGSDALQQDFYSYQVAYDFHEMLSQLYPADQKFVLVGHSTGAKYALEMAFDSPSYKTNIIGLILLNGEPYRYELLRDCEAHAYQSIKMRAWNGDWKLFIAHAMQHFNAIYFKANLSGYKIHADRI